MNKLVLALTLCGAMGCESDLPRDRVTHDYDEQEMEAAINRARSEVDVFIEQLTKGNGTDFSVKAPITDQGETEHFWLTDIQYRDGKFSGEIGNEPQSVGNVTIGQPWSVGKNEISDWMFMRDGKIHGNYTLRPLLKSAPLEEAAAIRSKLAEP